MDSPFKAKMPPKLAFNNLRKLREHIGENQSTFWKRFEITQPGGCRYETNCRIPKPAKLLLAAYLTGIIDDAMLEKMKKAVVKLS